MVFEAIAKLLAERNDCDVADIQRDTTFQDLGIDSLDAMELSMALEEAYGLTIDEDAMHGFVTVQNIVDYIDSKTE